MYFIISLWPCSFLQQDLKHLVRKYFTPCPLCAYRFKYFTLPVWRNFQLMHIVWFIYFILNNCMYSYINILRGTSHIIFKWHPVAYIYLLLNIYHRLINDVTTTSVILCLSFYELILLGFYVCVIWYISFYRNHLQLVRMTVFNPIHFLQREILNVSLIFIKLNRMRCVRLFMSFLSYQGKFDSAQCSLSLLISPLLRSLTPI